MTETKKEAAQVWEMSARRYQAICGVHAPFIGEISPVQYSRMSNRGKRSYDEKRRREWDASSQIKGTWRTLVLEAYEAGRFDLEDPEVHEDAIGAVIDERIRRKKEARKVRLDEARRANQIRTMDELEVGQTVYCLVGAQYGKIIKKNRKTVRVRVPSSWREEGYFDAKEEPRSLWWLSHSDLDAKVEEEAV